MLVGNVVLRKPFLYFHRVIHPSLIKSLFLFVLNQLHVFVSLTIHCSLTLHVRLDFLVLLSVFFLVSRPVCSRLVQVFMLSCFFFVLFVRQFTVLPVTLVLDVLEFVAFLILNLF